MLDVKKNTLRSYPSLLQLRMALIAAESESPSRPSHMDANEQRAMQLIEKMKAEYRKNHVIARSVCRDEAIPRYDVGDCFTAKERRLAMT